MNCCLAFVLDLFCVVVVCSLLWRGAQAGGEQFCGVRSRFSFSARSFWAVWWASLTVWMIRDYSFCVDHGLQRCENSNQELRYNRAFHLTIVRKWVNAQPDKCSAPRSSLRFQQRHSSPRRSNPHTTYPVLPSTLGYVTESSLSLPFV